LDRALFYATVVSGVYTLCVLVLLDNAPIALASGAVVLLLALARGMAAWG
jgi:hypothetical protein